MTREKEGLIVILPSLFDWDYEERKDRKVLFVIEHLRQLTTDKRAFKIVLISK